MSLNNANKLRIVFMGTPAFAVTVLDALVQNEYEIVGVVTAVDKPAGRGRKIHSSAVKAYAEEKGLMVLQPPNLKHPSFIEALEALKADIQIVVAFRMLPRVVWDMPTYGTFNLHASLLPDYRGAAPINWAIINGEKKTGVTTFFIDDKIDTGAIILQEETDIAPDDNAGSLHDRLMHLGAKVVLQTVQNIEGGTLESKRQNAEQDLKIAPKIHKDTCKVNWNQPIDKVYDFIRGLSPYPTAWTSLENGEDILTLKIYTAYKEAEEHMYKIGTVLHTKKEMKVAVQGGFIQLLDIQISGKRRMKTTEVLNGLKLAKDVAVV